MRKKLIIGLGVLLGLCLALGVLGSLLGEAPATDAPTAVPATATLAPTAPPTEAPPPATVAPATVEVGGAAVGESDERTQLVGEKLAERLANTACHPDLGADIAPWCDKIRGAAINGDLLILRAEIGPEDAQDMGRVLSAFVYDNRNAHLGLSKIVIFSDIDGATLYERDGL